MCSRARRARSVIASRQLAGIEMQMNSSARQLNYSAEGDTGRKWRVGEMAGRVALDIQFNLPDWMLTWMLPSSPLLEEAVFVAREAPRRRPAGSGSTGPIGFSATRPEVGE